MKNRLIWFSNKILPVEKCNINVLSPTSQFGLNVFEGIRGYWNSDKEQLYLFKLDEHCDRLLNSIKMMRFDCNYTHDFLKSTIIDIVRANNFKEDVAVRQTVFIEGEGNWAATSPVNMFVAPIAKKTHLKKSSSAVHICVSSWERISDKSLPPKIKLGANYMNSRLGMMEANRNGYDSTVFLNSNGTVSEGPGSCIFIVRDGQLITPPISSAILESITRKTIIEIAKFKLDIEVVERDIDRTELYICDEIFMCGSAVEITPVVSVDRLPVGDGGCGLITRELEQIYLDILLGNDDFGRQWLTEVY